MGCFEYVIGLKERLGGLIGFQVDEIFGLHDCHSHSASHFFDSKSYNTNRIDKSFDKR